MLDITLIQPNMTQFVMLQAYKSYVNMTGKVQQKLPGLSYNPDQLFFIGHAQVQFVIFGIYQAS